MDDVLDRQCNVVNGRGPKISAKLGYETILGDTDERAWAIGAAVLSEQDHIWCVVVLAGCGAADSKAGWLVRRLGRIIRYKREKTCVESKEIRTGVSAVFRPNHIRSVFSITQSYDLDFRRMSINQFIRGGIEPPSLTIYFSSQPDQ